MSFAYSEGLMAMSGVQVSETVHGVRLEVTSSPDPGAWTATLMDSGGARVALGSAIDPRGEADRQVAALTPDAPPVVFVFGLGLGYAVEAARARWPQTRIVALEPIAELAVAAARRSPDLFADRHVTVLTGPEYEGADQLWRVFPPPFAAPLLLAHPVLTRAFPKDVERMKQLLARAVQGARMNARARRDNAGRYLLNTLRNAVRIARSGDAGALSGAFAGVPAVIAAAGPSLNRNIEELRPLVDRGLLIAADTAWRPLVEAGLEPPLVVAVDPTPANGGHLVGVRPAQSAWLLTEGAVDPGSLGQCMATPAFWRVGEHEPWPWLADAGVQLPTVRVWGSKTGAKRPTVPENVSPGNASTSTLAGVPARTRRKSRSTRLASRRTGRMSTTENTG